ncbi:serine/threonine protein kinase [Spirosomataceae bacterium TFI 002]|nr:serine/threonine protein kinase [Spirosomataceae bacterium TFI 002]
MIGRLISTYRIEELIGEGGMGTVYRAVDTILGRDVALKMLHPNLISQSTFFERFKNEAQILARLNHPNIATLHNFIEDQGDFFMVMEYIEGEDLERKLKKTGHFSVNSTLRIAKQAIQGLIHAHFKGVFHRDLKPANLIVTNDNQVKIMDFGIAKAVGSEKLTQVNRLVGTLEYIAPELLKGGEPSVQSDLYALGVVMYELLTAKMPFHANTDYDLMQQIIHNKPIAISERSVEIPKDLWVVIKKLLDKKPNNRYATAQELSAALDAIKLEVPKTKPSPVFANFKKPKINVKLPTVPKIAWKIPSFETHKVWYILSGSVVLALTILFAISPSKEVIDPQEVSPEMEEVAEVIQPSNSGVTQPIPFGNNINKPNNDTQEENPPKVKEREVKKDESQSRKTKLPVKEQPEPVKKEKVEEVTKEEVRQEVPVVKEEPKPVSNVAKPQKITLSGQKITVALQETVNSANVSEGHNTSFVVTKPLVIKGVTVFSKGAMARGVVSDIRKSNALRKEVMEIRIKEVKAENGQWIPVKAAVFRLVGESSGSSVVFSKGQQFIAETTYITIEI